jgi:hypothetical protein
MFNMKLIHITQEEHLERNPRQYIFVCEPFLKVSEMITAIETGDYEVGCSFASYDPFTKDLEKLDRDKCWFLRNDKEGVKTVIVVIIN